MERLREKLQRFMYGRYGIDQLYYALIALCFILVLINSFMRSPMISGLMWLILLWGISRTYSRNIYRRRIENDKFMRIWNKVKPKFSLLIRRIKEIRTHRFRKCPRCSKVLRLPRRMGRHTVECPCCHNEFKISIRI